MFVFNPEHNMNVGTTFHGNLNINHCHISLGATNVNLMVVPDVKSGGHQSQ